MAEAAGQAPAQAAGASTFNFKHTIAQMVQRNASDLLLKVGRPPTVRVNGELVALEVPPVKPEDLKMLAEQVMTPRQIKEFAEKKEAVNSGEPIRAAPASIPAKSVIVILPVRRLHRGVAVGVLALGRDPVPRHDPRLLKLESLGDRGVEQTAVLRDG